MKPLKTVIICVLFICLCWSCLLTIDFSRLKNSQDIRIRPLITIHSHRTDKSVIYCGLGYSIEYYLEENHRDMYGLEIKVFGKMISAWIK